MVGRDGAFVGNAVTGVGRHAAARDVLVKGKRSERAVGPVRRRKVKACLVNEPPAASNGVNRSGQKVPLAGGAKDPVSVGKDDYDAALEAGEEANGAVISNGNGNGTAVVSSSVKAPESVSVVADPPSVDESVVQYPKLTALADPPTVDQPKVQYPKVDVEERLGEAPVVYPQVDAEGRLADTVIEPTTADVTTAPSAATGGNGVAKPKAKVLLPKTASEEKADAEDEMSSKPRRETPELATKTEPKAPSEPKTAPVKPEMVPAEPERVPVAPAMSRQEKGELMLVEMKNRLVGGADGVEEMGIEVSWAKRGNSRRLMRTLEIWFFFVGVLFTELMFRREKDQEKIRAARRKNAVKLRLGLLRLGPTFIKLGQLLSTRVDVLPEEYIEELYVLQDKVPGFPGAKAINIVERDLGKSVGELFDAFDPKPIAAASLGQVHLAVLDGKEVAVKVQRQGLKELFDVDLKNLKFLAQLLNAFDPKTDGAVRDWVSIYEESAKLLYEEIDYNMEGRNADRFRKNFEKVPWVKVPLVYWERTTTRVLTLEYCPGVKISNVEELDRRGIDRSLVAERSGQSYLTQLLRHGFFHCDPHPGNISVDGENKGRLIYYDFGMMAVIDPTVKLGLVNLIFAVYEGSERDICDALEQMGILVPGVDRLTVEKIGRYFLKSFRTNMSLATGRKKTKEETREELSTRLAAIGEDLVTVGDDQPFRFPAAFTFVFRAFTTLEGIGKGLTPTYDLTRIAQPYLKELIDIKDGSAAASAAKSLLKQLGWRRQDLAAVVQQPRSVDYVKEVMQKVENGELQVRARVLQSERAFKRSELVQEVLGYGIVVSMLLNGALVLSTMAERAAFACRMLWLGSLLMGFRLLLVLLKLRNFDRKVKKYTNRNE